MKGVHCQCGVSTMYIICSVPLLTLLSCSLTVSAIPLRHKRQITNGSEGNDNSRENYVSDFRNIRLQLQSDQPMTMRQCDVSCKYFNSPS